MAINIKTSRMRGAILTFVPIAVMMLFSLRTEWNYIGHSRGTGGKSGTTFVEIPQASRTGLVHQLKQQMSRAGRPVVLSDTQNGVLGKFEGMYTTGKILTFPAFAISDPVIGGFKFDKSEQALLDVFYHGHDDVYTLLAQERFRFKHINFYFRRPYAYAQKHRTIATRDADRSEFLIDKIVDMSPHLEQRVAVMTSTPQQTVLNRMELTTPSEGVVIKPLETLSNHLVFVDTILGQVMPRYGRQRYTAIYPLEPDYFVPNSTMSGIGRYLLLEVLNPTPTVRIVLDFTTSLKGDGRNVIPRNILASGTRLTPISAVGRGAARLISPPIVPQTIWGHHFVGIDMGTNGSLFPAHKEGAMNLYSKDIPLDGRRLVAFVRNIAALSERKYDDLPAVERLSRFPDDLFKDKRDFSGIYEDGWFSEDAKLTLLKARRSEDLVISGMIPLVDNDHFVSNVTVSIDGKTVASQKFGLGAFELRVHGTPPGLHGVEVRFSNAQRLPAGDQRLVGMKANVVGFQ